MRRAKLSEVVGESERIETSADWRRKAKGEAKENKEQMESNVMGGAERRAKSNEVNGSVKKDSGTPK